MDRRRLKCGGSKKRHKAIFGAIASGAATITAAAMQAKATADAAKTQAQAMIDNANTQAKSITEQTANNNALQKESLAFTAQQNQENRQQQQDIQTSLQLLAGQENMNDRMSANRMTVKYGGKKKNKSIKQHFYGGGNMPFRVTDGGGVIPLQVDNNGYGLYELYGNDHNHTHKAPNGKRKTGVGIKFADGSVVEGEGNQNSNKGEIMYVTPDDAVFLSKHNIAGFNPAEAVKQGVNPNKVFAIQETLKGVNGLNDDGTRKKANLGKLNVLNNYANLTQLSSNGTAGVAGGVAYAHNNSPVERYSLKCGGRKKAALGISKDSWKNYWNNYGGATMNTIGNISGAGLTTLGNIFSSNKLGKAYIQAGDMLADAYSKWKGIDLSELSRNDFAAPHTMAVVHTANTNINPQLQKISRDVAAERRDINRNTLSSAARQQRGYASNDRSTQKINELSAYKDNRDEQAQQRTAETINQTAIANADRDVQANKDYTANRLSLLQYNNSIDNAKIAGIAQAKADAIMQSANIKSQGIQNSMTAFGNAINASGLGFANRFDTLDKEKRDFTNTYIGLGNEDQVKAAILRYEQTRDRSFIDSLLNGNTISNEARLRLTNIINNIG